MSKTSRTAVYAVLCLFAAVTTTTAFGAGRDRSAPDPILRRAAKVKITVLRPSPESEVRQNLVVVTRPDGSRQVISRPRHSLGSPNLQGRPVQWTVDLQRGTYTAKWSEPTERDLEFAARARQRYEKEDQSRNQGDRFEPRSENQPTTGWYHTYATETLEPGAYVGFAGLTRTEAELSWSQCSNGKLFTDGYFTNCWSNASTFVNTTWYKFGCLPYEPPSESDFQLSGSVTGYYGNADFWDDSQWTYSTETVRVFAHSGGRGSGNSSHSFSGEFSLLLSGRDIPGTTRTRYGSCPNRYPTPPPTGGGSGGGDEGDGDDGDGDDGDDGDGDGDDGGGWDCAEVYDGESGKYLGDCCGYDIYEILDCAVQYLE